MAKTYQFYSSFPLDMERLSRALGCVGDNPGLSTGELARCMNVNDPVGEGYLGWLRHTGLLSGQGASRELTVFGRLAVQYDPLLRDLGTQWVLHYYLASEHDERSEAWYILMNDFLTQGAVFTLPQFVAHFADALGPGVTNRKALTDDPRHALGTYVQTNALKRLALLEKGPGQGNEYRAGRPELPSIYVLGYILFDWWQRRYDQQDTVRFSQLWQEPGSVGKICALGAHQVRQIVRDLAGMGWVTFAETQNEPVNRVYREAPCDLLQRYYAAL